MVYGHTTKRKGKTGLWKSCENLVNTNLSTSMVHSFSWISRDLQGVQPQKSEPMAVHGLLKGVTGSDLDLGAHRILKFQFNGSHYFRKYLKIRMIQRLKFDMVVVLGLMKTSNGLDHHLGSHIWKNNEKRTSYVVRVFTVAKHVYMLQNRLFQIWPFFMSSNSEV